MTKFYQHIPSKRICSVFNVFGENHLLFEDTGQCHPMTVNGLYSYKTIEELVYEN